MANEIAKLIVDHMVSSESLDGLELQEMFKQKAENDLNQLKRKLKDAVSEKIKNSYQPDEAFLSLRDYDIPGVCTNSVYKYKNSNPNDYSEYSDYSYYDEDERILYVVKDESTKRLIKNAIISLNLEWSLSWSATMQCYVVSVSWSHWDH